MSNVINFVTKNSYYLINNFSRKSETLVSKDMLLKMKNIPYNNRIINASQFVCSELPIRFSKRIKELEELPFHLDNNHEIFQVRDWYIKSLDDILSIKYPTTFNDCDVVYENRSLDAILSLI